MSRVLERVARTRDGRRKAELAFREALRAAREAGSSWAELADVAELSPSGVQHLVQTDYPKGVKRSGR